MRSPVNWFGGKGHMTAKLLHLLPPHVTYVEAFGGGASLLFAKRPSPVEVYNDINSALVTFFRVLRDEEQFERFYKLVSLTPVSREELKHCQTTWWHHEDDPVLLAHKFYVCVRQTFAGQQGNKGFGFSVTHSCRGMAGLCSRWLSAIEGLPQAHRRLMQVQIEHRDWRDIFDLYDRPTTLFYLDPPYVLSTRRSGGYRHEMSDTDHKELVEEVLQLKGMVLLSGYPNRIYAKLEREGWGCTEWEIVTRVGSHVTATGDSRIRRECVWASPGVVEQKLWRFVG